MATNWSGNLEFMEGLGPLLIPMRLVPVSDTCEVYGSSSGEYWADPHIQVAARRLRELLDNHRLRTDLAQKGTDTLAKNYDEWIRAATKIISSTRLLK